MPVFHGEIEGPLVYRTKIAPERAAKIRTTSPYLSICWRMRSSAVELYHIGSHED